MNPPSTASRPTSRGLRPGTANRGLLTSSSGRPTTGRLQTGVAPTTPGAVPVAGYGVALSTDVKVTDRPVTQQGLGGMRVGTAGPGRQVQDNSYFQSMIHKRTQDISSEIKRFQNEIEQFQKESKQKETLEKRRQMLHAEVLELQGALADHNMAAAKARDHTDPEDIKQHMAALKEHNMREAHEIDQIFVQRQQIDKMTDELDSEIHQVHKQTETKLMTLGSQRVEMYKNMLDDNEKIIRDLMESQGQIQRLNQVIHDREEEIAHDHIRAEYLTLEKKLLRLRKEHEQAEEEVKSLAADPEEARNRLLAKVKEDQGRIQELDQRVAQLTESVGNLQKIGQELDADLQERSSGGPNSNAEKYDQLRQRDLEMSAFIETFEQTKEKLLADQRKEQETVVALLEHVSDGINREGSMPTQQRVEEMKDDLSFKQRQLESAETTKIRLEQELRKRQVELEKLNSLDEKIDVELKSLQQKMNQMKEEMPVLENLEELKDAAAKTQKELAKTKQKYIKRKEAIKPQVQIISGKVEQRKAELMANEHVKALDALEKKLQHHEQSIFQLKEYIAVKGKETDYRSLRDECLRLVYDINERIKQRLLEGAHTGM